MKSVLSYFWSTSASTEASTENTTSPAHPNNANDRTAPSFATSAHISRPSTPDADSDWDVVSSPSFSRGSSFSVISLATTEASTTSSTSTSNTNAPAAAERHDRRLAQMGRHMLGARAGPGPSYGLAEVNQNRAHAAAAHRVSKRNEKHIFRAHQNHAVPYADPGRRVRVGHVKTSSERRSFQHA